MASSRHPASRRGAYARSSRHARRDCGGRGCVAQTNNASADGEIVRSWRPDAGAKSRGAIRAVTVARKPGSPGRPRISRKTTAQGMPVDLAEPVVTAACFFCCRRAMGEAITRHSLRPLLSVRAICLQDSDATRRENNISRLVRRVGKAKRAHRSKRGGHGATRLCPPYALL